MTIFFSGSISIPIVTESISYYLNQAITNKDRVIVGDANGADKAIQSYLYNKSYDNVVVYVAGNKIRNNLGAWQEKHIEVPSNFSGTLFYAEKDKAMAREADIGVMLWDGKSNGTWNNVINMLALNKKAIVCKIGKEPIILESIEQAELWYSQNKEK